MSNQFEMRLRALKGAPLSCLAALFMARSRPVGVTQLSIMTGYYKQAVSSALLVLAEMGLVEQSGRYDAWQLTAIAGQLPLFTPTQLSGEGGKSTLPASSSSSSLESSIGETQKRQLLPSEGGKSTLASPSPPALSQPIKNIAELLVRYAGCPRPRALDAVALAARCRHVAEIEIQFWCWLAYCDGATGKGINNRGAFIAAKLANNEDCPPGTELNAAARKRVDELLAVVSHEVLGEAPWEKCPHCGDPLRDDESQVMAECGHVVHEECADEDCLLKE